MSSFGRRDAGCKAVLSDAISGFGITFMDLLERARQQHKVGTTTTARPEQEEKKARGRLQGVAQAAAHGGRSTASPKAVLGQVSDKFGPRSRQSTISTNDPTRRTTVITTSSLLTTEKTADATRRRETTEKTDAEQLGVVKEGETATASEAGGMSVSVTEPVMMFYPDLVMSSQQPAPKSTEIPDLLLTTTTTPPFLPERPRSGPVDTPEVKLTTEIPETSTLTAEEIFTSGTRAGTTQSVQRPTTTTQIPSETSTAEQSTTITEQLPSTETETSPTTATTSGETSTSIFESVTTNDPEDETTSYEVTTRNPGWSSPERRPKRIRTDGGEDKQGLASKDGVIHSGQYHEVNPGQYSEIHPGQYHEQNPGQYHEVRISTKVIHFNLTWSKWRFLQVNPGQYHEVHPGQVDVESVKVDFQHRSKDRWGLAVDQFFNDGVLSINSS